MPGYKKRRKSSRKNQFILAGLIIGFVLVAVSTFYYSSWIDENRYDAIIEKTARKYNVDSRFIKAVISQESKFDSRARGSSGEIGLMQIMPGAAADWARHYKIDNVHHGLLFDPELNIEIGTWYLAKALKRWRNYKHAKELALCQYNAGGKRADNWKPESYDGTVLDRIKIRSTRAYVEAIMYKYNRYCEK